MNMRSFKEYLNEKGKLVKPVINADADTGPSPVSSPEKPAIQGKNWKAEAALKDKPVPYSGLGKDEGHPKYEKGFAQEGDKKLIYEPGDDKKTKEVATFPKTKTEQFIEDTHNLSNAAFVQYMSSQINPESIKAIQVVGANKNLVASVVLEIKKNGNFKELVKELFEQPEIYEELKSLIMESESTNLLFEKFFDEITAPTAEKTEVAPEDLEDKPKKKKVPTQQVKT
jgi:hypothetical protein